MSTPTTIRLSITKEVSKALDVAKKRYPALSDPEILKLGLSKIVTEYTNDFERDRQAVRHGAAASVGDDYLADPDEDMYASGAGKRVHFL